MAWTTRAAPRLRAARSLRLDETQEQRAVADDAFARAQAGWNQVIVADAFSERDVIAGKTAIGLHDVHEGQVVVVAQHRGNRCEDAAARLPGFDPHAHVHLLLQRAIRIRERDARRYRARVPID